METIKNYIPFRFPNWLDYARHLAIVHHFESWETDLLNDIILNLLTKPVDKLTEMHARKTTLFINGQPTTEIDKFVLRMLKVNAAYPTAPFRKNTLGHKIIDRHMNRVSTPVFTELKNIDSADEPTNHEHDEFIDHCHATNRARLACNGFIAEAIEAYTLHYEQNTPLNQLGAAQVCYLKKITSFLLTNQKTLGE